MWEVNMNKFNALLGAIWIFASYYKYDLVREASTDHNVYMLKEEKWRVRFEIMNMSSKRLSLNKLMLVRMTNISKSFFFFN